MEVWRVEEGACFHRFICVPGNAACLTVCAFVCVCVFLHVCGPYGFVVHLWSQNVPQPSF